MARWVNKIDISRDWKRAEKNKISHQKLAEKIAQKLKAYAWKEIDEWLQSELDIIIEEFEDIAQDENSAIEEFDDTMRSLYYWGDTMLDSSTWPHKKACWIGTF